MLSNYLGTGKQSSCIIIVHIHDVVSFNTAGLFDSAGLSVFNNSWSTVHDFTGGTGGGNWSITSGDDPVRIDLPAEVEDVGVSFSTEDSIVPLTVGLKQRPPEEVRFDVAIKLHYALLLQCVTQRLPSNFQSLEQPIIMCSAIHYPGYMYRVLAFVWYVYN